MKDLIKRLTEEYGPSGSEGKVNEMIKQEITPYVDEVKFDKLGSLIAVKKGSGAKVMLAAHADEIGLIVTYIDKEGFLRFDTIGGVSIFRLTGMRVVFADGLIGVISAEKGDPATAGVDKLYIDIGATSKEEAESKVSIGDFAVFRQDCVDLGDRIVAKAMDDRIGCVVLVEAAKRLKDSPNEIHFVFTVQEELGLRGATASAYSVDPDIGIAVDVTRTGDTPESSIMEVSLGKGPAIKVKDSGIIANPKVRDLLVQTAKEQNIPYQFEVLIGGSTDASSIERTRGGVPSGVISVPSRYVHSPSEMVDINDVENSIKLLVAVLEKDLRSQGF
ncbi:MAG: M42 family metallopeptidase [Candidatus Poribacteria bacterium]